MITVDAGTKLATIVKLTPDGWAIVKARCLGKCGYKTESTVRLPALKKLLKTIFESHVECHFKPPPGWILSRCLFAGCLWAVFSTREFCFCPRSGHETDRHKLSTGGAA